MQVDRFQARKPQPIAFDDLPPLEIGADHPWALDDDRPAERVANLDMDRTPSMDQVWSEHREARARAEERIDSALSAYDEPSAAERPEASLEVSAFLEDLAEYGETDPRIVRLLGLPPTDSLIEDEIIPLIGVGAFKKRLVDAHLPLLSVLPLKEQVTFLTDNYQQSALRVLKQMKGRVSEEERFLSAEYFLDTHPALIRKLRENGFTTVELDALVIRMAGREPGKAFVMRENLDDPYSKEEALEMLGDVYRPGHSSVGTQPDGRAAEIVRFGRLSKHDVQACLREYGAYSDERIRRLFAIPGIEGTVHWREADGILRRFESAGHVDASREQEFERFMEGTEQTEKALYAALAEAFPERLAAIEQAEASVRTLRSVGIERIGGFAKKTSSAPLRLLLEGAALPAVYKTPQREPLLMGEQYTTDEERAAARAEGIDLESLVRVGIRPGDGFKREWLCRIVSEAAQAEVVPATVVRLGPEGVGSVQEWRPGSVAGAVNWTERLSEERTMMLALFDYLVQHCDRHLANFLVTPEDDVVAIDNQYSFSLVGTGPGLPRRDQLRSHPAQQVAGREIPLAVRRQIRRMVESPKLLAVLRQAFQQTFLAYHDVMFTQFLQRVETIAPRDETVVSYVPNTVWI